MIVMGDHKEPCPTSRDTVNSDMINAINPDLDSPG